MHREGTVTLRNGEKREIFLHNIDPDISSVGAEMYETRDGTLIVCCHDAYRVTNGYRNFEKLENFEGGGNVLRLKDGRLMRIHQVETENIRGNGLKASNYYAHFSDDDGKTWTESITISDNNERLDLMNQRPKRMSTGRILLPISIHPNELLDERPESVGWITCFYSDDEGKTWVKGDWIKGEMVDQLCEPTVEEMPDGSLKMLARTGRGYLYQCDSFDGGETWGQEYPTQLRSAVSPYNFAFDPFSKRYIVCWNDSFPAFPHQWPRTPICVAVSDDAVHWTKVLTLGDNPLGTYGYPAFHFAKEEIHITYYINPGRVWEDNRVHFAAIPRSFDELLAERS